MGSWLSVVGGWWVGETFVSESAVGCWWLLGWWSTCWWVGGQLSVVSGSVEHLLVGRLSVIGGRWVGERPVGGSVVSGWWCGRWLCNTPKMC